MAVAIGGAVLAAYTAARVLEQGQRDEASAPADAIVILGAAVDRGPTPVFRARLDHAVALYQRGGARYLVVTGGRSKEDAVSEAEVARDYALRRGVPETALLSEATGHDTVSSLQNVARLFQARGLERAIFVSDRSHMLRVLLIAEGLGITARGSPTPSSPADTDPFARVQALAHEVGGLWFYLLAEGEAAPPRR